MKKLLMSTAGVVLTIAICMGLAGCSGNGALAEARSIRGEEVSEEEWNAAFKGLGGEESFTVPLSVAAEEGQTPQVSPANFAVEYETETRMDVTVEEQTVNGEVLVEAAEASVTMKIWATVTVADHKMHMEVGYDGRVDGSENVLEQLGGETISGSGGVEVYTAVQDGVTQVYARVDGGEWQTATGGASALEGVSEAVLAQIDVLIDELSDIGDYYGQYKDFTYNGDKKGYVYQGSDRQAPRRQACCRSAGRGDRHGSSRRRHNGLGGDGHGVYDGRSERDAPQSIKKIYGVRRFSLRTFFVRDGQSP